MKVCSRRIHNEKLVCLTTASERRQNESDGFEYLTQATLMWVRKSKVLNKYESNSDWLNGSWKERKNIGRGENYPKGSWINNLNPHALSCLWTALKGGQVRVEEINQHRKDQQNCLVQRYVSEKKWDILSTVEWMVVFEVFGRYKSIFKDWYEEGTKYRRKVNTGFESLG